MLAGSLSSSSSSFQFLSGGPCMALSAVRPLEWLLVEDRFSCGAYTVESSATTGSTVESGHGVVLQGNWELRWRRCSVGWRA